jgi:hypothetical protein
MFMPLNKKTVRAHVHADDEGKGHLVGCHGDRMAFVMDNSRLKICNIYIPVSIDLPSIGKYWSFAHLCRVAVRANIHVFVQAV